MEEWFFNQIDKNGEGGCWLWLKGRTQQGYGHFKHPDRGTCYAHRFSYELHFGAIPDGLLILHSCDNPPCVNPNHLFLGTYKDNTQDMIKKKRHPFIGTGIWPPGAKRFTKDTPHPTAKLDESKVLGILELLTSRSKTRKEIALEYDISVKTVEHIAVGYRWPGVFKKFHENKASS